MWGQSLGSQLHAHSDTDPVTRTTPDTHPYPRASTPSTCGSLDGIYTCHV
jgi:hypothetical protein